jgi:hypothetical protein
VCVCVCVCVCTVCVCVCVCECVCVCVCAVLSVTHSHTSVVETKFTRSSSFIHSLGFVGACVQKVDIEPSWRGITIMVGPPTLLRPSTSSGVK